jgi:hypothetical protein
MIPIDTGSMIGLGYGIDAEFWMGSSLTSFQSGMYTTSESFQTLIGILGTTVAAMSDY